MKPLKLAVESRQGKLIWAAPTLLSLLKRCETMGATTAPAEVTNRDEKHVDGAKAEVAARSVVQAVGGRIHAMKREEAVAVERMTKLGDPVSKRTVARLGSAAVRRLSNEAAAGQNAVTETPADAAVSAAKLRGAQRARRARDGGDANPPLSVWGAPGKPPVVPEDVRALPAAADACSDDDAADAGAEGDNGGVDDSHAAAASGKARRRGAAANDDHIPSTKEQAAASAARGLAKSLKAAETAAAEAKRKAEVACAAQKRYEKLAADAEAERLAVTTAGDFGRDSAMSISPRGVARCAHCRGRPAAGRCARGACQRLCCIALRRKREGAIEMCNYHDC